MDNSTQTKKPISEAHKAAQKRYIQKIKDNEEHKEYKRQNSKRYYEANREKVIERVKNHQNYLKSMYELHRLDELKNQGSIA